MRKSVTKLGIYVDFQQVWVRTSIPPTLGNKVPGCMDFAHFLTLHFSTDFDTGHEIMPADGVQSNRSPKILAFGRNKKDLRLRPRIFCSQMDARDTFMEKNALSSWHKGKITDLISQFQ